MELQKHKFGMDERKLFFSKRYFMLIVLLLACINLYPQGAVIKAIRKATIAAEKAAKRAEKIEPRSYNIGRRYNVGVDGVLHKVQPIPPRSNRIGEKYVVGNDGVLHRIQRVPTSSSRTVSPAAPVRGSRHQRHYLSGRAIPYAATQHVIPTKCPICHGTGRNQNGYSCKYCGGTGLVTRAKAASYSSTALNTANSNSGQPSSNKSHSPLQTIGIILLIVLGIGLIVNRLKG